MALTYDCGHNSALTTCEFESCSGEVYSIQYYVITFVNDLRQILWFPLPIKLTFTIWLKYCWKWR